MRAASRPDARLVRLYAIFLMAVVLLCIGHAAVPSPAEAATTLTVTTVMDVAPDAGVDGFCSLRAAVRFANGDVVDPDCGAEGGTEYTVLLTDGATYQLTIVNAIAGEDEDAAATGDLDIHTGTRTDFDVIILVAGGGAATVQQTVVDRVFDVHPGASLTLAGITVTGGTALDDAANPFIPNRGGGILNTAGVLTLTDCTVTGNTAESGGGVYKDDGMVTVTNCDVSNNIGDGILQVGGTLDVTSSRFSNNRGSGIASAEAFSTSPVLTVTDSTFTENNRSGIFNFFGNATLTRLVVTGNSAGEFGGGIRAEGGETTLTDSTVSRNSAPMSGGGIYAALGVGTRLTVINTIISDNGGGGSGGGIYGGPLITLVDTTVARNQAERGGGIFAGGTYNLVNTSVIDNVGSETTGGIHALSGRLTLTGSTVSGNRGGGSAGGIFVNGPLTLIESTVSGNTAPTGQAGGILLTAQFANATTNLLNSTISHNTSANAGGIFNETPGTLNLTNVTVTANTGGSGGGGIVASEGTLTVNLRNTIVADQLNGNDCSLTAGSLTAGADSLDSDGTCGDATTGNANLAPLGNYGGPTQTHALLSGSEAIDAASQTLCDDDVNGSGPNDQRGDGSPRTVDGDGDGTAVCDIGAFEFQEPAFTFAKQCEGLGGSFTFDLDFQFQPAGIDDGVDFDTKLTLPCGGQAALDPGLIDGLVQWWQGLEASPAGGTLTLREQDLPEGVVSAFAGDCASAGDGTGVMEVIDAEGNLTPPFVIGFACTVTNSAPALTVTKACLGAGFQAAFVVQVRDQTGANAGFGPIECGGTLRVPDLAPGAYTLTETIAGPDAGDFTTAIACADGTVSPAPIATLIVAGQGEPLTCVVVNVFDPDGEGLPDLIAFLPVEIDLDNDNTNVIGIDNDNANTNANDNINANENENTNQNANDNANTNTQDQANDQAQDNTNEQTNNIDSGPEVNVD